MSSAYFRSYSGVPPSSYSQPSARRIPVAKPPTKTSPKVISIPVHFVGSERRRSDSALKIQKVLRGFLVRKNMKKIAAIRNEVQQIERRLSERETIDLVKKDSSDRLRINETLMNLLLRLDSVTSVDPGVRGCRKSVIKKAIALQEKLDLITSSNDVHAQDKAPVEVKEELHSEARNGCRSEEIPEQRALVKQNCGDMAVAGDCGRSEEIPEEQALVKRDDDDMAVDRVSELRESVEAMPVSVPSEVIHDASRNPEREASTPSDNPRLENETITKEKESESKETPTEDFVGTSHTGEQSGTSTADGTGSVEEGREIHSLQENDGRNMIQPESDETLIDIGRREEQNPDRRLLEKMVADNKRMMRLMAELFERNEIQTRILSSLFERVKQLEKAFACDKSRKKKKRNAATAAHGPDELPDTKKCDNKH